MNRRIGIFLNLGFFVATMFLSTSALALAVIANSSVSEENVDAQKVRDLFLGRARLSVSGMNIVPVDQPESSVLWREFAEKVLQKNPQQLKAYWNARIFTGRGTPPMVRRTDAEVLEHVSNTSNAIGYVRDVPANAKVKVLLVVP